MQQRLGCCTLSSVWDAAKEQCPRVAARLGAGTEVRGSWVKPQPRGSHIGGCSSGEAVSSSSRTEDPTSSTPALSQPISHSANLARAHHAAHSLQCHRKGRCEPSQHRARAGEGSVALIFGGGVLGVARGEPHACSPGGSTCVLCTFYDLCLIT